MIAIVKAKAQRLLASVLTTLVLVLIGLYRSIGSLWLGGACRFEPSCSAYAQEAIARYGFWVGGKLTFLRLLKCRPGGPFGLDQVPRTSSETKECCS